MIGSHRCFTRFSNHPISKKSIASVIREAVTHYKSEASKAGQAKKMALYDSIVESAVQIDVPVLDLVKEGRKFE